MPSNVRWQDVFRIEPAQPPRLAARPAAVCHGYANCCSCPRCLERAALAQLHGFTPDGKLATPAPHARQPWEPRPSRRAA